MNGGRLERWPEVERLLDQLLDIEPEARPPLLARIREADPEMATEVERLLDAIAANEQFLQESAPTYAAPLISRMLERNDLAPGTVLGSYEITSELGRGGMATVYLAQDLKLQRAVALKVLRRQLAATLGSERFVREIAIAARLNHPHILPLHNSGEVDGQLYYTMPHIEGESLRQKLEREGQLPIPEVIAIVSAVADALTYAHQHGIVHRDIKPENILLTRNPGDGALHPLVADFGIARALDKAGGERLTETGMALGTPPYMSPEQASPDSRLDGRSDIYSLGCVAYEMLAGAPPFTGASAQTILARHAVDPPAPLHTVRSTIPPAVEAAIERALAKVPADRFPSADEFAQALTARSINRLPRRTSAFWRKRIPAALALLAAAGLGVRLLANSTKPAVLPSASKLAVMPLLSLGSDTALSRLGRDLANTISASLNGVGGIETADRLSIASSTADKDLSPTEGATLARQMGATSIVHGTLVSAGDQVRIDLGLYDTENLKPLAIGVRVTAHRDSIRLLTDSASLGLLRQVWQRGEPPSPSLAAVTTTSVSALRAFLDGERAVDKDQWEEAALSYGSAIAADSTFWLAYFRYTIALYWQGQHTEPAYLARLYQHSSELPERERLLVEAWSVAEDSVPLQLSKMRELSQRFPDYWPAWFLYADRLFHLGPFVGYHWDDAQEAFKHAVAVNPRLKPAWVHMFENSLGRDTVEASRALAALVALPFPDMMGRPKDDPRFYRGFKLYEIVARSGGLDSNKLRMVADTMARARLSFREAPRYDFLYLGFPAEQVMLNDRSIKMGPSAGVRAVLLRERAWAWAERGAWDSALATMSQAVHWEPEPATDQAVTALDAYDLAVLGAWLGTVEPQAASALRQAASEAIPKFPAESLRTAHAGHLAWVEGIAAFTRGDRTGIVRASLQVQQSKYPDKGLVTHSLAAFGRALAGDRRSAGRELAALEWQCGNHDTCFDPVLPHIVQRLAAATWLLEAGDTAQAARLLTWHEAAVLTWWPWFLTYSVRPVAYLISARIEEAQGKPELARQHYGQFLRRYDRPMPDQVHLVAEARSAIARLSGADPNETR